MPSAKRLSSVCHSIAHHAVSGLCFIHPHLALSCRASGLTSIVIDLLRTDPCPQPLRKNRELRKEFGILRKRFEKILDSEGFKLQDVTAIVLQFEFNGSNWPSNCHACLVSKIGRIYRHSVNNAGESIAPNKSLQPRTLRLVKGTSYSTGKSEK